MIEEGAKLFIESMKIKFPDFKLYADKLEAQLHELNQSDSESDRKAPILPLKKLPDFKPDRDVAP